MKEKGAYHYFDYFDTRHSSFDIRYLIDYNLNCQFK
jgi:hypothetical protein